MTRRLPSLLGAALLVAACSSTGTSVATPGAATAAPGVASPATEPMPTEAAEPTEAEPTEAASDEATEPTDAPDDGPDQYEAGQTVVVSKNGEDEVEITVSKVKEVDKYKGDYVNDEPQQKGNVFIQAFIEYKALVNDVSYNPLDWQVFADGAAVDNFTFVINGPEPTLGSGTLPEGRTASGWVVYEVPAKGEVLLSYGDILVFEDGPVFEVKIR